MTSKERLAILEDRHRGYRGYNQDESSTDALMALNGHPFSAEYQRLRAYFDRLKYASNSGTRYIAFRDNDEHATYGNPSLDVKIPGMYPGMGELWMEELRQIVDKKWVVDYELNLGIHRGWLHVRTSSRRLLAKLFVITGVAAEKSTDATTGVYQWSHRAVSLEECLAVLDAIEKGMRRWVLPPRTEQDTERDHEALPLAERDLVPGPSNRVEAGPHFVTVPLIPFGPSGTAVLQNSIRELLALCDKGYDWKKVRAYCKDFVKPAWLREQDKRYHYSPPKGA